MHGQICGTPYGDLDPFAINPVCSTFGWIMQPGGALDRIGQPGWGTWSYAAAPHTGSLLFQNNTATQKRAGNA